MKDTRVEAVRKTLVAQTNVLQNWEGIAIHVIRAIDKADAAEGFQRVKRPIYWPGEDSSGGAL